MMSTAPPFPLTHERAARLQLYIQIYRRYTLSSLLPSAERNAILRLSQAILGKLVAVLDQKATVVQLALTREEMDALKAIVNGLLLLYTKQQESPERLATLSDLAALKKSLKSS